jgi:hypothetical protein
VGISLGGVLLGLVGIIVVLLKRRKSADPETQVVHEVFSYEIGPPELATSAQPEIAPVTWSMESCQKPAELAAPLCLVHEAD